jgi:hypothetical protein
MIHYISGNWATYYLTKYVNFLSRDVAQVGICWSRVSHHHYSRSYVGCFSIQFASRGDEQIIQFVRHLGRVLLFYCIPFFFHALQPTVPS